MQTIDWEKFYDTHAPTYDTASSRVPYVGPIRAAHALSRYSVKYVLDLGCGTGKVGEVVRKHVPSCSRLVGVDMSRASLDVAQSKNVYDQLLKGNVFDRAFLLTLPPWHDAVICVGALEFLDVKNLSEWLASFPCARVIQLTAPCTPGITDTPCFTKKDVEQAALKNGYKLELWSDPYPGWFYEAHNILIEYCDVTLVKSQ